MHTILVTGGAGFIGSAFVLLTRRRRLARVVTLDLLTYAGNLMNLEALNQDSDHLFVRGDIADRGLVRSLLERHRPQAVVNFAAESHVDRSIDGPEDFIRTNVVGTFHLLEECRRYRQNLPAAEAERFRLLHVSTDEVYGSLAPDAAPFTEAHPYTPNSPYSASKAASDHLVRAYHQTYGLPTITTNCSNNYGPRQFPEKLIPLLIVNGLKGAPLPIYGDGLNVRDWLYVEDHCEALHAVLDRGRPGEVYNIGGNCERSNLEIARAVCRLLDALDPAPERTPHEALITFVADRPGHDRRYAIDSRKIQRELGWRPRETFETGLDRTLRWYLDHRDWLEAVQNGSYRAWIERHYRPGGSAAAAAPSKTARS